MKDIHKVLDRPEARSFLRCILEEPANDVPRLILADWLDEQGQPERAEFIRLQCELLRLPEEDPRRFELEEREWVLLLLHGDDWLKGLPDWILKERPHFERGFVADLGLAATQFLRRAETLLGLVPLQHIHLRAIGKNMAALAESPHLKQIRSLRLSRNKLSPADLRTLTASPHLEALRELDLSWCELSDDALELLASWLGLARITRLDLSYSSLHGHRGLRALLASSHGAGLRSLDLTATGADAALGWDLARSRVLTSLKILVLSAGRSSPGMLASLGPNGLKSLCTLKLRNNDLGNEAVFSLTSAGIESLRSLDLSENRIGLAGARALAGCQRLAQLTSLNLENNAIGAEGAAVLAPSPYLANLRLLNLSGNRIGNEGVAALVSSPHLARLRALLLHVNELDEEAVRLLASSPHLGSLRHLGIGCNPGLRAASRDVLRDSPQLPHLTLLDMNYVLIPVTNPAHPVQHCHRRDGRPFFTR